MITPTDLGGDEDLARRVIMRAQNIAPCIHDFADESEDKKNVLAILKGVLAEVPAPGSRRMRSLSRNGTAVTYEGVESAFSDDDIAALRSLCNADAARGMPQGAFPQDRLFENLWPEERYP